MTILLAVLNQGMADAYELTIREGDRRGWWIEP